MHLYFSLQVDFQVAIGKTSKHFFYTGEKKNGFEGTICSDIIKQSRFDELWYILTFQVECFTWILKYTKNANSYLLNLNLIFL